MRSLIILVALLLTSSPLFAQDSMSLVRNKAQIIASQLNDGRSISGVDLPTEFNHHGRKIYAVPISVAERYGGNGSEEYLAVYELGSGGPNARPIYSLIAFARVGGKMWRGINFKSMQFANDTFYFEAIQWGPGDPGCCPSEEVRVGYRLTDRGLVEI